MKLFLTAIAILATTACGPRQVVVSTGAQPVTEVTLRVTNNLTQPVNVYVNNAGNDIFVKQVAASSVESMPVPGISAGTSVTLKATPADGSRSYTRNNVTLSGLYEWTVP